MEGCALWMGLFQLLTVNLTYVLWCILIWYTMLCNDLKAWPHSSQLKIIKPNYLFKVLNYFPPLFLNFNQYVNNLLLHEYSMICICVFSQSILQKKNYYHITHSNKVLGMWWYILVWGQPDTIYEHAFCYKSFWFMNNCGPCGN